MSGVVRSVMIRMTVNNTQAVQGTKQLGDVVEQTASRAQRSGVQWNRVHDGIEKGAKRAFLGGALALGVMEKSIISFDKGMSGVDAATHETAGNMKLLRDAAIDAGAKTSFSATEAAGGITELAKAGVSTKDVLGGGLAGALDLAAAGQIGVAEAAETAASAMTQFSLKGGDVPHIADLLAAGAGKAQGSVHDLGMALNQTGLVASQMGLSIEDTTGTLAAFASNGLVGSDAGTSFKTMLLALNPRSKEAATLMRRLNIEAYDAQGKFVGITEYAGKLRKGLRGLTDEQRGNALKKIFGQDAIRAANILYKEGAKGIDQWVNKVDDSGYAADTAGRQLDNLAGDFEKLKGSLETAFIKGGSGATSGLRGLVQDADDLVNRFNRLPASVQSGTVKVIALGTAIAGAVYILSKLVRGYQTISTVFGGVRKLAGGAAGGVSGAIGQRVFVTNWPPGTLVPGGPDIPGKNPKGIPPVVGGSLLGTAAAAGAVLTTATVIAGAATVGIMKLFDKFAPSSAIKGSPTPSSVAGAGGGMSLGDHPFDFSDSGAKNIKATRAETDALATSLFDTGAALAVVNAGMNSLPTEVQTVVKTPGALESIKDVEDLATLYNLTPQQVQTVMELSGFDITKRRIVAAGDAYKRLPRSVRTKVETPGALRSLADVQRLAARYNLTPRQVRTLMQVTGTAPAAAKVKGLRSEIERIRGKIAQMGEKGAAAARDRIRALQRQIDALRGKSVDIVTNIIRNYATHGAIRNPANADNPKGGADGMTIPGARTPYGDKVIIAAAPGEELISNRYGQADRFRADRAAGRIPGYAGGGTVGQRPTATAVAPSLRGQSGGYADLGRAVATALQGMHITGELQTGFGPAQLDGRIDGAINANTAYRRNLEATNR